MKYNGFTLIELLVVVLIIGILAAIALPQYNKAVYKARYASIMDLVNAVANAEELYYLANGTYTTDISNLDVSLPADYQEKYVSGRFLNSNEKFGLWMDMVADDKGRFVAGVAKLKEGLVVEYGIYLQHSDTSDPRKRRCRVQTSSDTSNEEKGKEFCLSVGGVLVGENVGSARYVFALP